MGKIKIIIGVVLLVFLISTGWQIAACECANYELKDDLKDVAPLGAPRIGLATQQSDDQLRTTVIRKAAAHDIVLDPDEIRVQRFAAKYRARVWIPGLSLVFHFTATSGG